MTSTTRLLTALMLLGSAACFLGSASSSSRRPAAAPAAPLQTMPTAPLVHLAVPGLGDNKSLGWSVDVSGDTAIAGAPDDNEFGVSSGAAHLFRRQADGHWEHIARIPSPVRKPQAHFGATVAIHGDYAAVSVFWLEQPGEVYVYARRPDGSWDIEHPTLLRATPALAQDEFGFALDMDEDMLIVGQMATPVGKNLYATGQAWVFERTGPGNRWSAGTRLSRERPLPPVETFGYAVGIGQGWAIVGAPPTGISLDGSAAIYRRLKPGSWQLATELANPEQGVNKFGHSVALRDGVAVVGAPDSQNTGAVFVYRLDESTGTWSGPGRLEHPQKLSLCQLGTDVDTQGGRVLAGYPSFQNYSRIGGALLFHWTGSAWEPTDLLAPGSMVDQFMGYSVALDGERAVVGAWHSQLQGSMSGAVFAR